MSEISTNFTRKKNYYLKDDVDKYVSTVDAKFQEKDAKVETLLRQVSDLEARVQTMTDGDATVEEKVELYDKLMKKMGDDYQNLLAPAIAKAKLIQEESEKESALRIDQAKYSADGIYDRAAEKIAEAVDDNIDRLYDLIDDFLYSKTLPGRIETLYKGCSVLSKKMAQSIHEVSKGPKKFFGNLTENIKAKTAQVVEKVNEKRESCMKGMAEDTLVDFDPIEVEPEEEEAVAVSAEAPTVVDEVLEDVISTASFDEE